MIKTILSDFARVILFPKDTVYEGGLNPLHSKLQQEHSPYVFLDYFYFNEELLDFYMVLKPQYELAIVTETVAIQQILEVRARMREIFDNVFTTNDIGLPKSDFRTYLHVAKKLGKDPDEIVFIDDRVVNIVAAQNAGLQTIQYRSNEQLFGQLKELGVSKH